MPAIVQSNRLQLAVSHGNLLLEAQRHVVRKRNGGLILPGLPAMADSLLLLQVLLSEPAVNLHSVTEVIRGDVGLTVQLLRLQNCKQKGCEPVGASIAKHVVHAGIEKLLTLATEIEPISCDASGKQGVRECEQFWGHARLTALMAEELALKKRGVSADEAYVAGLLFHLDELPSILALEFPDLECEQPHERRKLLARQWGLPALFSDILCGGSPLASSPWGPALDLARVADQQALRLQGLVANYARRVF